MKQDKISKELGKITTEIKEGCKDMSKESISKLNSIELLNLTDEESKKMLKKLKSDKILAYLPPIFSSSIFAAGLAFSAVGVSIGKPLEVIAGTLLSFLAAVVTHHEAKISQNKASNCNAYIEDFKEIRIETLEAAKALKQDNPDLIK